MEDSTATLTFTAIVSAIVTFVSLWRQISNDKAKNSEANAKLSTEIENAIWQRVNDELQKAYGEIDKLRTSISDNDEKHEKEIGSLQKVIDEQAITIKEQAGQIENQAKEIEKLKQRLGEKDRQIEKLTENV